MFLWHDNWSDEPDDSVGYCSQHFRSSGEADALKLDSSSRSSITTQHVDPTEEHMVCVEFSFIVSSACAA